MVHEEEYKFKNFYTVLFTSNYFFQGVNGSVFAVIIPIYLISFLGGISAADIAFIASIIMIPWGLKVFYGSTNFSISMAFSNIGTSIGLLMTSILLNLT